MSKKNIKNKSKESSGLRFDFLSKSYLFAGVSAFLMVISIFVMLSKGFNYGIDFSGGAEVQVRFNQVVTADRLRSFTKEKGLMQSMVQAFGDQGNEFLIRLSSVEGKTEKETNSLLNALIDQVESQLKQSFSTEGAEIMQSGSVGPQVGSELKLNGLLAAFYALLMILIYVGLRFDYKYAPGAVFCLFHDAIITMGIFSLFGREVNVQTMAAILTIIGYSLNDTIVTFDRIRENVSLYRDNSFYYVINRSLNDVLSRTLLTSITTMLAVAAMYFFANGVIRDFAFTLGIGVIVGTYSSIYVASPLVLLVDKWQHKN